MSLDNIADAQKEIEKLNESIKNLTARLEVEVKKNGDAQSQIGKQSNEIGAYRDTIDNLQKKIEEIEERVLGKDHKAEKKTQHSKTDPMPGKDEIEKRNAELNEEIEKLSSILTEEDEDDLNKKFDEAGPELQVKIENDPVYRKRFLENHLGERAVQNKKRSWRSKPAGSEETEEARLKREMDELFDAKKKRNNFVPPGSGGAITPPNGQLKKRYEEKELSPNAKLIFGGQKASFAGVRQG